MQLHRRILICLTLSSIALFAAAANVDTQWQTGLQQWREHRAQSLSAPTGWLTLVGLEWLKPGSNTFGSAADNQIRLKASIGEHLGILEWKGNDVFLSAPASNLLIDGIPAHAMKIDVDGDSPTILTAGTLTLQVLHRGDRYALRVKDSQAPTRVNFRGLHWYAPDPRYRFQAKWTPFTPPREESIPTIIGTTLKLPVPGVAEFTLDGHVYTLEPVIEEPGAKQLFFILRDTTSKTTTYGAARFLYTDFPDHGLDKPGHLTLDFNRLQNPPCAYTPYATCPLPPPQNKLKVALPVGEQRYSH